MAIVEDKHFMPLDLEADPDDYRPDSELAVVIDPVKDDGVFVDGLTAFFERLAPGDRIPMHQHTVEEVLLVDEGKVEVRLGEARRVVSPGAVVFIPAGTVHGFANVGAGVARIHAVFPAREITIRYLERNPAPGTEDDDPGPPIAFDVRELVEGNPEQAVRVLDASEFSGPVPGLGGP